MPEREGVKTVGSSASSAATGESLAPTPDGEGQVASSARDDGEVAAAGGDGASLAGQSAEAYPASQLEVFHRDCPSCGERLIGDFCHRCGEKRPESRDLTLRYFFKEAAHELTSVEHSKLFHTLWAVLFRPGFLTNEWIAGRRRLYLKPLNLYLGIFALSLFAYSAYKPVSTYSLENVLAQPNQEESLKVFDRFAAKKGVTRDVLFDRIEGKWQRYMSLSPLLVVGGFAMVLALVFLFSRRYFVEHLVFSMHFISFSTLTVLFLWPIYFFTGIKPGGANILIAIGKWLIDIVYVFFAVRAVYGLGAWKTLLASLLLVVGYIACYVLVFVSALILAIVVVGFS